MRFHPLSFIAAVLLGAVALPAQSTVRGTLFDSLRTNRPIAGVEVSLLGTSRRSVTDSRGRFEFTEVAAGSARVAFAATWLDSLALPPLMAEARVAQGRTVDLGLATPSLASYQIAVCGTKLPKETGIILGDIRYQDGSPGEGVPVGARWIETRVGVGQLDRLILGALDTANANGFFAICGIPMDSEVAFVAATDDVASGEIIMGLRGEPVVRRDLLIAPRSVVSRIRGRLVGVDGLPLVEATVALIGDTAHRSRTDANGRFTLEGAPRRSSQLIARALGHVPSLLFVEPIEAVAELDDLVLSRLPQELATVTVTGEPMTAGQVQFEVRKRAGMGFFVEEEALKRLPVITSSNVSAMIPRTFAQQTPRGPMLMVRRGGEFCRPRFYIDGYDNGDISAEEEGSLMARAKRIEVYTASSAPPQFNDFDGCGAVVIWTR